MAIKRKDFQKAAAVIHEFHLKLSEDGECAELRDALNLALLHMQRYYRVLRSRLQTQDKSNGHLLATSVRGLSPMTPFKDAPDKFQWRWINIENARHNPSRMGTMPADILKEASVLPMAVGAAKQGHNDMLMQIIERDKHNLEEADSLGRTALMYAVHFGHLDSVQILLEHGIDVNAAADDGSTAVHRACHDGNFEALQILIEYSADLSQTDVHGRRPIHWACACKTRECLQLLIENGVDVNVRDNEGMTPSMWACRLDHISHFELLSKAEQNISEEDGFERDNYGRTWMHWAVRRTEPLECLKTLLTEDTAKLPDDFGRTVMHTAAEIGSSAAVRVILEIGGQEVLEHRDQESRTPLIIATIGGHGELVNFLLAEGADLACVDNTGATAWDYARGRQLHYCMLIIASYIRQRAKDDNGIHEGTDLSMAQLQINGDEHGQVRLFKGNQPMPPPHPPQMPPSTPRTPRSRSHTPGTPRNRGTVGPSSNPQAPATPRLFGVKRTTNAPLGSSSEEETNNNSERVSSGSNKRKKNEPDDRDKLMSVMSIDSVADRVDSVVSGELSQQESQHDSSHQSHDQSQQHSQSQQQNSVHHKPHPETHHQQQQPQDDNDHQDEDDEDPDSVSIGDMDVSDLEQEDEDDEADGGQTSRQTHPANPFRLPNSQQHPQSPHPPPRPSPRFTQKNQQLPSPSAQHSHPHFFPTYQKQATPDPSPTSKHPPSSYQEYSHEDYVDEEDDDAEQYEDEVPPHHRNESGTPPHTPFAPPIDNRGLPPAHLSPLPPPSPTRRKKKKKKKERDVPDGWGPENQQQGYAAPVAPGNPIHVSPPPVRNLPGPPQPSKRKHPPNSQGQMTRPSNQAPSGGNPPLRNRSPSVESEIEESESEGFALDGQLKIKSTSQQHTSMPSLPGAEGSRNKSAGQRPVQSRAIDRSRNRPNPPPRVGSANKSKLPANLHGEPRNTGADYLNQGENKTLPSNLSSSIRTRPSYSLQKDQHFPPRGRRELPSPTLVPPINKSGTNRPS